MHVFRKFEAGIRFDEVSLVSVFLHGQIKMGQSDSQIHLLDISQGAILQSFILIKMNGIP